MISKQRIWEIVAAGERDDRASRLFDILILSLIFLNVIAVILGSMQAMQKKFGIFFDVFELFSVAIFTVEYAARLWACTTEAAFRRPFMGRFRYALRPMSIIDLLAILPYFIPLFTADLRVLRVLHLFRILRIVKIARYSTSLRLVCLVLQTKKEELVLTSVLMGLLLILSSSVLFYCEYPVQPESFSSIPTTMWWAIATLTTVGYGDMTPVTVFGRFFASIIAILGIGMFALPTGIIGAGFIEEIQKKKDCQLCPHCGEKL